MGNRALLGSSFSNKNGITYIIFFLFIYPCQSSIGESLAASSRNIYYLSHEAQYF